VHSGCAMIRSVTALPGGIIVHASLREYTNANIAAVILEIAHVEACLPSSDRVAYARSSQGDHR